MIIDLNLSNDAVIPNMPSFNACAKYIHGFHSKHVVNLFITLVCLFIVHVASKIPV